MLNFDKNSFYQPSNSFFKLKKAIIVFSLYQLANRFQFPLSLKSHYNLLLNPAYPQNFTPASFN